MTTDALAAASAQTDEQLLMLICAGDHPAYAMLVNRHADTVYGYLVRLTRSHADAEDLLQETFIRIWRKAGSYQPGKSKVSTWIHRIAHNLCMDSFRSKQPSAPLDDRDLISGELIDDQIAAAQLASIEAAIAHLPENQRAALLLCQLQGFSNAETAEILGLRLHAVESLVARARRTLRSVIAEAPQQGHRGGSG